MIKIVTTRCHIYGYNAPNSIGDSAPYPSVAADSASPNPLAGT